MIKGIKDFFWGRIPLKVSSEIYPRLDSSLKHILQLVKIGRWIGSTQSGSKGITAKEIYDFLNTVNYNLLPEVIKEKIENLYPKFKIHEERKKAIFEIFSNKIKEGLQGARESEGQIIDEFFNLAINDDFEYGEHGFFRYYKENEQNFNQFKKELNDNENFKNYKSIREEILREGNDLLKDLTYHYNRDLLSPERRKTIIEILTIVLTVILVSGTIWTAWTNQSLVENQLELSKRQLESISPLKPTIQVSVKDPQFANWELASPLSYFEDGTINTWNKETVSLLFTNIGQTPAGYISFNIESDLIHAPSGRLDYLGGTSTGENSKAEVISLWYKKCGQAYTKEECNENNVPFGIFPVNITIRCQNCEKEIISQFNICIYNISRDECSNFEMSKKK